METPNDHAKTAPNAIRSSSLALVPDQQKNNDLSTVFPIAESCLEGSDEFLAKAACIGVPVQRSNKGLTDARLQSSLPQ